MTRRDYCTECQQMVHDNDVWGGCGHAQCSGCIVPYDYKTALFAINSRFKVYIYPKVQVKDLEPFRKHVEMMLVDMTAFRATLTDDEGEYYDEIMPDSTVQIPNMFADFNVLIDAYKNADPNTCINNNDNLNNIISIFCDLFELITEYEIYEFVCHRCNARNVQDKYVADLEVENAKLRQENIELKECMNMANEDKKTRVVNVTYIVDDPSRLL